VFVYFPPFFLQCRGGRDTFNLDGEDFTILVFALDQPVPPAGTPADLNHDGAVDTADLRLFADLRLVEHGTDQA
jgi:hypothetical protein